jgi:hypothetical protein
MKYFLWIGEKQDGPYNASQIIEMLLSGTITKQTLYLPEGSSSDWEPLSKIYASLFAEAYPQPAQPQFRLPAIEDSGVAKALTIIAALELIGSPIVGLGVGSDNAGVGWLVFISGEISGLILLGFARVIQNTFESSQRLRRLEMLMQRSYDNKPAA